MKGWTQEHIDKLQGRGLINNTTKPSNPQSALFALGRTKGRKMNKTEASYAGLLEARKRIGEVLWYEFEPMNLRLADNCYYRVDFMVLLSDWHLEVHETKGGFVTDDALVKIKAAAAKFPFKFIMIKHVKGNWEYREF